MIFLIQATRGGVVGAASIQSYSREGLKSIKFIIFPKKFKMSNRRDNKP